MTPEQAARYARQLLLPEIGAIGQARIMDATANIDGDGLAHEVARRYVERAGFGSVAAGAIAAAPAWVKHDTARDVLAGSRAAVSALLTVLR